MISWNRFKKNTKKTALVLSGGGARAAYQVGVLKAIAQMLPREKVNPYPIITGVSAGAINATALACYAKHHRYGIKRLEHVWANFQTRQVYRSDAQGLIVNFFHWINALMGGVSHQPQNLSLLNNHPLRDLLRKVLPFDELERAIQSGALYALCVTASAYTTGESVSFYQGSHELEPWQRHRRIGCRATIGVNHLLASSAIPFVFPPIRIDRQYYGDGSIRFLAPVSPAIHLGAEQILIIGVDPAKEPISLAGLTTRYPGIADVAGHVLDSIFVDSLNSDIERLQRVNNTVDVVGEKKLEKSDVRLKNIETLMITPSENFEDIAGEHFHRLSRPLKFFMRRFGISESSGKAVLSFLLFESTYTQRLISLGYEDSLRQRDEIEAFFAHLF